MSNFEHNPGKGTIFRETDKSRPAAYTGSGKTPDGMDVWINLYPATDRETGELRKDKDGNPYYNVGLKPKQPRNDAAQADYKTPADDDLDSEIPF